jgi:hypothetical protein
MNKLIELLKIAFKRGGIITLKQERVLKKEKERRVVDLHQRALKIFLRDKKSIEGLVGDDNQIWRNYANERDCWGTYNIHDKRPMDASRLVTKEQIKKYITLLLDLDQELNEPEILGLAMVKDEIDYRFALGIVWYPSPIDYLEKKIMGELVGREKEADLPKIINSLVAELGCDPFNLEGRIRTLYKKLNCRQYLK